MAQDIENIEKSPDISTVLSAVLSKPETLSKISEIITKYASEANGINLPQNEDNSQNIDDNTENATDITDNLQDSAPTFQNVINPEIMSKLPEILSAFSSQKSSFSKENNQQTALLLAIRPYLSEHRRELIDSFIKIERLGSILKKLT